MFQHIPFKACQQFFNFFGCMWSCIILKKNNLVFPQGRSFQVNFVFKNFQLFTIFFSINCFPWIKNLKKYHSFFNPKRHSKELFCHRCFFLAFFEGVSLGIIHDLSFLKLSKNIHFLSPVTSLHMKFRFFCFFRSTSLKSFLLFSLFSDKSWGSQIFFFWIIPIFFILFEIPLPLKSLEIFWAVQTYIVINRKITFFETGKPIFYSA